MSQNKDIYSSSFRYKEDSTSYIVIRYTSSHMEGFHNPDTSIYFYDKKTGYIKKQISTSNNFYSSLNRTATVSEYVVEEGKIISISAYALGKEELAKTRDYQYSVDKKDKKITVVIQYEDLDKVTNVYFLRKDGYYYKCDCEKGITENNKFCDEDCNERREENNISTISTRKLRKRYIIEYY